jgi:hypothetical protein
MCGNAHNAFFDRILAEDARPGKIPDEFAAG